MFADCYRNKKVFITGHTGFKGSWLSLWLSQLSAKVYGYALAPLEGERSHYAKLALPLESNVADICDFARLSAALQDASPEIVFHLAAQPLVLESYRDPVTTWNTNVMGTVNLLEACRHVPSIKAVVVITTDKCYQNQEWSWPYRECDALGGHDPYSASKAAAELVVASYRASFSPQDLSRSLLIATARAGNVIGGGDWAQDRLVPDAVRAVQAGRYVEIRNPKAVRPWQHVLEPLSAYLLIGQHLLAGNEGAAKAWNVGPSERDVASVAGVLDGLGQYWPELKWQGTAALAHETQALRLDSSQIATALKWSPVWPLSRALAETAAWYRRGDSAYLHSLPQLHAYIADAAAANLGWAI
ncbi:CDP-glucose 4,6-dehydratase [Iodobacter fluviatilis]|uniref:CDP-glucose 4,6-dehydratase n=1 Tax=Iodobacter fluviatilis TaxID=537 RepID=A0A7G3GCU5_9NEIS|nr:CDP-glucose 4,6-dehydratase [Iodobacter fluviatilis]QBC44998.1 CDP-glucose 4,6-dehydratase [Iodobacter fluviatilis]